MVSKNKVKSKAEGKEKGKARGKAKSKTNSNVKNKTKSNTKVRKQEGVYLSGNVEFKKEVRKSSTEKVTHKTLK